MRIGFLLLCACSAVNSDPPTTTPQPRPLANVQVTATPADPGHARCYVSEPTYRYPPQPCTLVAVASTWRLELDDGNGRKLHGTIRSTSAGFVFDGEDVIENHGTMIIDFLPANGKPATRRVLDERDADYRHESRTAITDRPATRAAGEWTVSLGSVDYGDHIAEQMLHIML